MRWLSGRLRCVSDSLHLDSEWCETVCLFGPSTLGSFMPVWCTSRSRTNGKLQWWVWRGDAVRWSGRKLERFFVDFFFLCRIKCLPLHCRFLSWKGVGCEIREYSMRKKRYDRMTKPDQSFGKVVCNCLVLNLLCNLAGFIRISVS